MPRFPSCPKDIRLESLAIPTDTRSPNGGVGANKFRFSLNAITDLSGKLRRFGAWRRLGYRATDADGNPIYLNQDLHDQLLGAASAEAVASPPEVGVNPCVATPNLRIAVTPPDEAGLPWTLTALYEGSTPTRWVWYIDRQQGAGWELLHDSKQ